MTGTPNSAREIMRRGMVAEIIPDGNPAGRAPVWLCDGKLHVRESSYDDYLRLKAEVTAQLIAEHEAETGKRIPR